jgi:hypothetical protein
MSDVIEAPYCLGEGNDPLRVSALHNDPVVCLGAPKRQHPSEFLGGEGAVQQHTDLHETHAQIAKSDDAVKTPQLLRLVPPVPVFGSTHTGRSSPISS